MSDEKTEADVERDDARADDRSTGGVAGEDDATEGSTTSPTPKGEFVGRVAGEDLGYTEETGAERRAEQG